MIRFDSKLYDIYPSEEDRQTGLIAPVWARILTDNARTRLVFNAKIARFELLGIEVHSDEAIPILSFDLDDAIDAMVDMPDEWAYGGMVQMYGLQASEDAITRLTVAIEAMQSVVNGLSRAVNRELDGDEDEDN